MSLYSRNYGSWSSKNTGSTATSTPSTTLDRSSRYGSTRENTGSGGLKSSTSSTTPSYRSSPTASSVRERAAQMEVSPPKEKPSIREKYASRSYGVEPSSLRKSPEPKAEVKTPTYKRYSGGYSPTSETPSLRFGSSSRFGGQIARSPLSEKSPTIFGVSTYSRSSKDAEKEKEKEKTEPTKVTETITLVTRGTSPTPPSTSSFLRSRRAEMDRTIEKTVPKLKPRHTTYAVECQTDEKCIEDAKLESKLSAASALTARTPSSSSAYSRFSSTSTKYTPRTSAYHGNRPTELSLKSTTSSVLKHGTQDETKSDTSPTKEEKSKRFEGKDTTRIGGFSYARPNDLPLALNKAMAENKTDGLVSPSKVRSTSPQTPTSIASLRRDSNISNNEKLNKSSLSRENSELNDDAQLHSTKPDSSISSINISSSVKLPSPKLTSPDRCKLPPPSPKLDFIKNIPNKDFRKSDLNKGLSSSNESLISQKSNTSRLSDKNVLERSPSTKSTSKLASCKSLVKIPSSSPSPNKLNSHKSDTPLISSLVDKAESSESSSEESTSSETSSSETESSDSESNKLINQSNVIHSSIAGSKLSLASSRTSAQMSSADEASVSVDKPPIPPSNIKSNKVPEEKTTDDAKSVVVRAIAPVATVMKVKYPVTNGDDIADKDNKPKDVQKPPSPSNNVRVEKSASKHSINGEKKPYKIQHIQSGERAWWMGPPSPEKKMSDKSDSDSNLISKSKSKDKIPIDNTITKTEGTKSTSASESEMKPPIPNRLYKLKKADSSSSDVPSLEKSPSMKSIKKDKSSNSLYKIKRIESGEKAWWLKEGDDNSSSGAQELTIDDSHKDLNHVAESQVPSSYVITKIESGDRTGWLGDSDTKDQNISKSPNLAPPYRMIRVESGDRSGWLGDSDSKDPKSSKSPSPAPYRMIKVESGDRSGWLGIEDKESKPETLPESTTISVSQEPFKRPYSISKIESGERAWWLGDSDEPKKEAPPPPVSKSPSPMKRPKNAPLFIGRHTNIDDVLGTQAPPPAAFRTPQNSSDESDVDSDEVFEVLARDVKIHEPAYVTSPTTQHNGLIKLDDTALQLYKEGDYGSYLDLDASINEQQEEFENFQSNKKNSIVLRTQLSVRVHTIIEKLMSSEGRELRRALFSLKQIFQEDKDLVHEFVQNEGLACLIKVGTDADQNYQNYILRALGQVMLYVDGMNGVIEHSPTIQWLYSLVASKFRLVVKTALKLLLVFVEYVETNSVLLVKAIQTVDSNQGSPLWSNVMRLMKEYDAADTELLIYATSLINKTLNGLPDQDTYYDQVDALEEQGFENIIRRYMAKQGTDLDLLRQFQIYEAVLQHEDGEQKGAPLKQLDETIRKTLRHRKSLTATLNPIERRKSRRHSTGTTALHLSLSLIRPPHELDPASDEYQNVKDENGVGVTPALRRRRERAERQRTFLREQREASLRAAVSTSDQSGSEDGGVRNGYCNGDTNHVRRENTVKDLTQMLASTLGSPGALDADGNPLNRVSDMKGIISRAKEGLAKSQSKGDVLKSPTSETPPVLKPPEVKKTETELHWEELVNSCSRALALCDLDFTDLHSDDEQSVFAPASRTPGIPPPPPPCGLPPPIPAPAVPPPLNNMTPSSRLTSPVCKNKKTVKLFWKEVRDDPVVFTKLNSNSLIWDELSPVSVDTQKLEHLFESRAKDLITKKQQEMNKNKEVIVLDPKRSNAINIGMTKLPPPRSIKTAILKMDATIMNREGIEKLLTMLPTEEECSKIQEAQAANPDLPLGSAEQFLLTLASINELPARLKLWAFKLDFDNAEKEIAEPLMDLKQGMETLKSNKTFRAILGTLLSIGIFLNGNEVKGFQIEYLAKVPEVKDTVHKHSLLHHLCHMVMDKFPDSTDLYSEIGAVTRASKVDFDELATNLNRLETECKASFDHLKEITKHDGSCANMKVKMSDFLADCAEHIIVLIKVHKRVVNRYFKFCLWLGIPYHRVQATKANELCRIVSEFALEYRTTRERVMQQLEKKASHRERNKTRGKMITEVAKFRSQDDRADAELRQLLGNDSGDNETSLTGSLPWRRQRKDIGRMSLNSIRHEGMNGELTDADDEIIETLVKTATKTSSTRAAPRERKRTRHADRKSLRRTLRNGLSEEERKHLATFIKGY